MYYVNFYYCYSYYSPVYHNSLKSVPKLIIHRIHLLLCRCRKTILFSTCIHSTHTLSTNLTETVTMNPIKKKTARNLFMASKIHTDKLAFYINTNEINLLTVWMNSTTCYWPPATSQSPCWAQGIQWSARRRWPSACIVCRLSPAKGLKITKQLRQRAVFVLIPKEEMRTHSINLWFPTCDPSHLTELQGTHRRPLDIFNFQQKTQWHLSGTVGLLLLTT